MYLGDVSHGPVSRCSLDTVLQDTFHPLLCLNWLLWTWFWLRRFFECFCGVMNEFQLSIDTNSIVDNSMRHVSCIISWNCNDGVPISPCWRSHRSEWYAKSVHLCSVLRLWVGFSGAITFMGAGEMENETFPVTITYPQASKWCSIQYHSRIQETGEMTPAWYSRVSVERNDINKTFQNKTKLLMDRRTLTSYLTQLC